MNPLVSIIIPVFNQIESHLRDCIDSALCQTYRNIEIVVSDNHSTNGATDVILEYQNEKLRSVRPLSFLNMTDNFAFAASCANPSSKYLSFLSSDDLLAPNAIAELVGFAENNQSAVFVAGNIIQSVKPPVDFDQLENRIRSSMNIPGLHTFRESIALFCPWQLSSTWMAGDLIRHDAYNATGGFAACDYYMLGDLWLTKELLKQKKADFGLVCTTTAFFRQRAEGVLPADGERGLSVYLDILAYNSEMLGVARDQTIGCRQRLSIHWSSLLILAKIILLILIARGFHKTFLKVQEENFELYIRSTSKPYERHLIAWAVSVKGMSLYLCARLARVLVITVRLGLSRVKPRGHPV